METKERERERWWYLVGKGGLVDAKRKMIEQMRDQGEKRKRPKIGE